MRNIPKVQGPHKRLKLALATVHRNNLPLRVIFETKGYQLLPVHISIYKNT